jgi:S-ribosylhomocysteine lyase
MNKIASFKVNHDKLKKGIYLSRTDGDIITYDLRFCVPNSGVYLSNGVIHTIEHLFATYARNSEYSDQVIYFGPMGCRTGFYFLVRDKIAPQLVIDLIKEIVGKIACFQGEIPGAKKSECGNYLEHDLLGANLSCEDYYRIISSWTVEMLKYPE